MVCPPLSSEILMKRILIGKLLYYGSCLFHGSRILRIVYNESYSFHSPDHILFFEASAGHGRSAQTQAACNERALRIIRYRVLVRRYIGVIQKVFGQLACNSLVHQLHEHEMVVCSA